MKWNCSIYPDKGILKAAASYDREELSEQHFLLNRDFVIHEIRCDGTKVVPEITLVKMNGWYMEYCVQKVAVPGNFKNLEISYIGRLSGNTGAFPYVREQITTEFTFIRWETFPYPFFCENDKDEIFGKLPVRGKGCITVTVPDGYEVIATERVKSRIVQADSVQFAYEGSLAVNNFNCSIAPYKKVTTTVGTFFLLNDCLNIDVEDIMKKSHEFMNSHFGVRNIAADTVYAAIPENFGNFASADAGVVYVQESTFASARAMGMIIHEFIHLGWNAKAEGIVQRMRFFDEAFTCYFQMRVMEVLTGDNDPVHDYINSYRQQMNSGKYELVPISEFGKYEYGDLNYTIGPVFLYELCSFIGEARFDKITEVFLRKYKDIPVSLETFCDEYAEGVDACCRDALKEFFNKWLYLTDECGKFLNRK